ncbi:hypothetical protein SDJN03_12508, partial [Cucurbita argyrosperma subsp. sororia]
MFVRKYLPFECARRRRQLHVLCLALKAESDADLLEILCRMDLFECVYKRCVGGPCPYLLELPAWSINFIKFLGGFWSQYGVE